MGSINGVERVEVVRRSRRWSDPSIIGQGSQPFKSITYLYFKELCSPFNQPPTAFSVNFTWDFRKGPCAQSFEPLKSRSTNPTKL